MARKFLATIAIFASSLLLHGCYTAPIETPPGILFSDISSTVSTDMNRTPVSVAEGRARSYSVLGIIAWGDSSLTAAAREGKLKYVTHLDFEYYNILFCYQRFTLVARGEQE